MKDVVLIGMPGCGKSTLGKKLACALNRPFVDLDGEIVRMAGKTIPEIFEEETEDGFRRWETKALKQAMGKGQILATGGGIVTREENRPIAKGGLVIYIDRPLEQILGDVRTDTRPLLKEGKERLLKLYEQRAPLYRAWADVVVENTGSLAEITEKLVNEVKNYENYGD